MNSFCQVYDENWTPLGEYITGNVFPLSIKSKSRKITIMFVTDNGNALVASGPSKPSRWQASFYVEESTETTTLSTTKLPTASTEMTTTPHPGSSVTCNSNCKLFIQSILYLNLANKQLHMKPIE